MIVLICEICTRLLAVRKRAKLPRQIHHCAVCGHELDDVDLDKAAFVERMKSAEAAAFRGAVIQIISSPAGLSVAFRPAHGLPDGGRSLRRRVRCLAAPMDRRLQRRH